MAERSILTRLLGANTPPTPGLTRSSWRTAARLPASQARRQAFCIRGIGFDTIGAITWAQLTITPRPPLVPGDGIQPAWGTRLAVLPADQCIDLPGVDHTFFMEHRATQQAIAGLLNVGWYLALIAYCARFRRRLRRQP